jgi:hypothetical protein
MTDTLYRCTHCREQKPRTEFYGNPGKPAGRSSWCKPCARESSKVKSQARRDAWREKTKDWPKAKRGRPRKPRTAVLEPVIPKVLYHKPKPRPEPRKPPKKRRVHRIRAMSQEKREWMDLYRIKCENDTLFGVVYDLGWDGDKLVVLRKIGSRAGYQRHHVARRIKWAILLYRYCSPELHSWIENNSAKARELGMLFNLECGELRNPSPHDPFNVKQEIEELKFKYS